MVKLTAQDAMDRHITPAIVAHRNKMNAWLSRPTSKLLLAIPRDRRLC